MGNTVGAVGDGVGKTVGGATKGVGLLSEHPALPFLDNQSIHMDSMKRVEADVIFLLQIGDTTKAAGDNTKSATDSVGGKKQTGDNPLGL